MDNRSTSTSFSVSQRKAGRGLRSQLKVLLILAAIGGGAILITLLALLFFEIEDTIYSRGKVVPEHTFEIVGHLDAPVTKFHFRMGQDVKAGDVLAELDPKSYEAGALAAETAIGELAAELELKKAELAILEKEPLPQSLWYSDMNYREAFERNKRLSDRLERSKKLQLVSAISKIEFEKVELEAIQGEADLARAGWNHKMVKSGLGKLYLVKARKELALVQAKLDGKKKELAYLKKCIASCRLIAPANGRIVDIPAKNLWYVSQGKAAFVLASGTKIRARCKVDASVVRKVKPGQKVRVTSDIYNWLQYGDFDGIVKWIADTPAEEGAQALYTVEVELAPGSEEFALKYGSGVEVAIITGRNPAIFVLLNIALESDEEKELRRRRLEQAYGVKSKKSPAVKGAPGKEKKAPVAQVSPEKKEVKK